MPRTITGRLLLASAVTLAVALSTVSLIAPPLAQGYAMDVLAERLRADATAVAALSRDGVRDGDSAALDTLAKTIGRSAGIRVTIVAGDGRVLGDSAEDPVRMEDHSTRPEVATALGGAVGRSTRRSATVDRELLYVAVPIEDGSRVVGVARTAFPLEGLETLAGRLAGAMLLAAVVAGMVAFAVALLVGRAITRPIRELAESARAGSLSGMPVAGATAELRELSSALSTAWREAAAKRRETEEERDRLATLISELSDAVMIVDPDDRIRAANPAAERLLAAGPLVGRRVVEVVREHETLDALERARAGDEVVTEAERHDPPRTLRVLVRALPGRERLLTIQDLTRLRRLETVRRDFIANVSHELRTPIASIKAMVEALEGGALREPEVARDFLSRIHTEIDDLAQLVNELLDLSRAESGASSLELEDVPPGDLVRGPIERLAPLASRSGVTVDVADLSGLPRVRADRQKVAQVLMSLLHNAIKFTPGGGRVDVSARTSDGVVRFEIRDTGIGLRRDEIDRIFERFYKGERSRAGSGTGLGLAIAKHVVQAHGGTIAADSEGPGRGSAFTFTLPIGA